MGKKVDCLKCHVCWDTVLLKDRELAINQMYGKQKLLKEHLL